MNIVVAFPKRRVLNARENLAELIAYARSLQVFGADFDYDSAVWDLSSFLSGKPGAAKQNISLYFTLGDPKLRKKLDGRIELTRSFADVIKTIICLKQHATSCSPFAHQKTLIACRFLHQALAHCGQDIVEARTDDFQRAANLAKDALSAASAYHCSYELERIAGFVTKHQISAIPIHFYNTFERPEKMNTRVDEESRANRASKLPSRECIAALVDVSLAIRATQHDPDLARICVAESLICAPWRINELLGLRADCERWEGSPGDPSSTLGIVHDGSKGAPDQWKPVPRKMTSVAARALADLRRLTQASRDVARFLETHPGRAWLPEPWLLADPLTPITNTEIATIMGFSCRDVATLWMSKRGELGTKASGGVTYRLEQFESAILSSLPIVPPGRRLSEYLFLFPQNYFHDGRAPVLSIPSFLTQNQIRSFLVGSAAPSIFQRLGILDGDGKPFKLPSHGLRHFLNNLANEGMLSDLDIARWSGRNDITQNSAYDHTGGAPLGRKMRELLETKAMQGPIVATANKLSRIDREEFLKARFATAHVTEIGMCVQDWSLAPCPSHGSCAGCGDHLVVKGNAKHKQRAERLLEEHQAMLAQAKQEMEEGTYGASNWVQHNQKMVEGLKKTLAVHNDSGIADDTLVQVPASAERADG